MKEQTLHMMEEERVSTIAGIRQKTSPRYPAVLLGLLQWIVLL